MTQKTGSKRATPMKILKNYRYYVMTTLCSVGMLSLIAVPTDENDTWFATLIFSKLIALVAFYALHILTKKWESRNNIPEFTNQNK